MQKFMTGLDSLQIEVHGDDHGQAPYVENGTMRYPQFDALSPILRDQLPDVASLKHLSVTSYDVLTGNYEENSAYASIVNIFKERVSEIFRQRGRGDNGAAMLKFKCTLHVVDITSRNILGTSSAHQREIYCYMHIKMGVSFNEWEIEYHQNQTRQILRLFFCLFPAA